MRVSAVPLAAALVLTGCDLSMTHQSKRTAQGEPGLWPGGPPRAAMPEGTIDMATVTAGPLTAPALTPALLARGADRYAIFCTPCHGTRGDGDGEAVRRGFPAPPPFRSARLRAMAPADLVAVVRDGHGVMYSYADRIAPADRWAVVAYVEALQRLPDGAR